MLDVKKILGLLLVPKAASLLAIKAVCGIPIGVLQSMFSGGGIRYGSSSSGRQSVNKLIFV